MGRYLMFVSYIGTHYHGIQIQKGPDHIKTVQGVLEKLLRKINPWNETKLFTSSRTDCGVHALSNALHFDYLHREHPHKECNPDHLTYRLNSLLRKSREAIRIISIQRVNDDFHSRYKAIGRSYLYRLAISQHPGHLATQPVSILDQDMILRVIQVASYSSASQPFNTDLFLKSVELLSGTHDFRAFTTTTALRNAPGKNTVKTLTVGVKKGTSLQDICMKQDVPLFDYWDLHFHSSSYLYHQVRIMVGAMIQVGRGKLLLDDLQRVLEDPEYRRYIPQSAIEAVQPGGLYLKQVHYDAKDLVYTPRDIQVMDTGVNVSSNDQTTEEFSDINFEDDVRDNGDKFSSLCNMDHLHSLRTDSESDNTDPHTLKEKTSL